MVRHWVLFCFFFCGSVTLARPADWYSNLYANVMRAQNSNTYPELIQQIAANEKTGEEVFRALVAALQNISGMPNARKEQALDEILLYFSQRHQIHKPRANRIEESLSVPLVQLKTEPFDAEQLARELIKGVIRYEKNLTVPLLEQIEAQTLANYHGEVIFNIGRDFTANQIYLALRQTVPADKIYSFNISRAIRDLSLQDGGADLVRLLASAGLTAEKVRRDGIIFMDSSMSGKIPRAILAAFAQNMNAKQLGEMLCRVQIRYIRSKYTPAETPTLAQNATRLVNAGASRDQLLQLLRTDGKIGIDRFPLNVPAPYNSWPANHLHNLFEHRPKFLMTATRIAGNEAVSPAPESVSDMVNSYLGLAADVALVQKMQGRAAPFFNFQNRDGAAQKPPSGRETDLQNIYSELNQVSQRGLQAMREWQGLKFPEAEEAANAISIVSTGRADFPYELYLNGARLYRFKRFLSAGNNVQVFLTEKNTAVKIVKNPKNARKQLMQAWVEPLLESYGFQIAKTIWIHPSGMIMEQEYVPGDSLEYTYGFGANGMPNQIQNQVIAEWKKAKELSNQRDIWLDIKAANYHVKNGKIVCVDYTPRLNSGYWRYFFAKERGQPLNEAQFIDEFLHHDIRKGNHKLSPLEPNRCEVELRGGR